MWGGSSAACASVDARGIHREWALYVVRRRGGRDDASPFVAAKTMTTYEGCTPPTTIPRKRKPRARERLRSPSQSSPRVVARAARKRAPLPIWVGVTRRFARTLTRADEGSALRRGDRPEQRAPARHDRLRRRGGRRGHGRERVPARPSLRAGRGRSGLARASPSRVRPRVKAPRGRPCIQRRHRETRFSGVSHRGRTYARRDQHAAVSCSSSTTPPDRSPSRTCAARSR